MKLNEEYLNIDLKGIKKPETLIKKLMKTFNYSLNDISKRITITYPQLSLTINGKVKVSKRLSQELGGVFNIHPYLLYKLRLENDINEIQKEIKKLGII